ncbi:MAG: hypothetical protein EHM70_16385 [Chloroflexota bacterium]|nr:MAG: hypothetical protein EHM70_16385 [Chloroflexota bacterium]
MPPLSKWMVRFALVYLALGFTFGALILWNKGVPLHPALWLLVPVHVEFLLVGWLVQFVFGVAFWILPRLSPGPKYGRAALAWLAFGLLNAGAMAAALARLPGAPPALGLAGRLAEAASALLFAAYAWPRIRGVMKPAAKLS